jgi:hypothetical protein
MKKIIIVTLMLLVIFIISASVYADVQIKTNENINVLFSCHWSTWAKTDKHQLEATVKKEFNKDSLTSKLINDIIIIQNYINTLNTQFYTTKSGAKVFEPIVSAKISILKNAIYQRQLLIKSITENTTDKYIYWSQQYVDINDLKNYFIGNQISKDPKYINTFYNDCINVLESKVLPKNLVKDLKVYILPFELKNGQIDNQKLTVTTPIDGYETGLYVEGKEESIVVTIKRIDALLHELGHVYFDEIMGYNTDISLKNVLVQNMDLWKKYVDLYPSADLDYAVNTNRIWDTSLYESCAEDFKMYFANKIKNVSNNGLNILKSTSKMTIYDYSSEFPNFIEELMETKKISIKQSFPEIRIGTNTNATLYGSTLYTKNSTLNIKNLNNNCLFKFYGVDITYNEETTAIDNVNTDTIMVQLDQSGTYKIDIYVYSIDGSQSFIYSTCNIIKL